MKIVNVGCGATPTKGAINIDNSFTIVLANNKPLLWLAKNLGFTSKSTEFLFDIDIDLSERQDESLYVEARK